MHVLKGYTVEGIHIQSTHDIPKSFVLLLDMSCKKIGNRRPLLHTLTSVEIYPLGGTAVCCRYVTLERFEVVTF